MLIVFSNPSLFLCPVADLGFSRGGGGGGDGGLRILKNISKILSTFALPNHQKDPISTKFSAPQAKF